MVEWPNFNELIKLCNSPIYLMCLAAQRPVTAGQWQHFKGDRVAVKGSFSFGTRDTRDGKKWARKTSDFLGLVGAKSSPSLLHKKLMVSQLNKTQWEIIPEHSRVKGRNIYVIARCPHCKTDREVRLSHIKSGRSRMCTSCSAKNRPSNQLGRMRPQTKAILELFVEGKLSSIAIAQKLECKPSTVYSAYRKYIQKNGNQNRKNS